MCVARCTKAIFFMSPHQKTTPPKFKYVFGPVYSWRLGISLGIDPLSVKKKTCNYNCIYCQLGRTQERSRRRQVFVPVSLIIQELRCLPNIKVEYITFAGRGEPTLASNLGRMIRAIRCFRSEKIAVITNGSLLYQKGVRRDLALADFVLIKLDAADVAGWRRINRPVSGIGFKRMFEGIKKFRRQYKGRFGLQIMLMNENQADMQPLAGLAREIQPDEIQLNTPLRKNPVKPLSRAVMQRLKRAFKGFQVRMVYETERKKSSPIDPSATRRRHGTE